MKIIALETAADPGSVAVWRDGDVFVRQCPEGQSNSSTLLPLLADCLSEAGLGLSDLDGIAFGKGPGSFTGLRIACGVAQGLAVARDTPLIGIGSLDAMAHICGGERVLVALDARMGEVYVGLFEKGAQCGSIGVYAPGNVPLPPSGGWLACGNGLDVFPELRERLAPYVDAWRPDVLPSAEGVASLAATRFARGERINLEDAVPFYVRDKVARTVAERVADGGKA